MCGCADVRFIFNLVTRVVLFFRLVLYKAFDSVACAHMCVLSMRREKLLGERDIEESCTFMASA